MNRMVDIYKVPTSLAPTKKIESGPNNGKERLPDASNPILLAGPESRVPEPSAEQDNKLVANKEGINRILVNHKNVSVPEKKAPKFLLSSRIWLVHSRHFASDIRPFQL